MDCSLLDMNSFRYFFKKIQIDHRWFAQLYQTSPMSWAQFKLGICYVAINGLFVTFRSGAVPYESPQVSFSHRKSTNETESWINPYQQMRSKTLLRSIILNCPFKIRPLSKLYITIEITCSNNIKLLGVGVGWHSFFPVLWYNACIYAHVYITSLCVHVMIIFVSLFFSYIGKFHTLQSISFHHASILHVLSLWLML